MISDRKLEEVRLRDDADAAWSGGEETADPRE